MNLLMLTKFYPFGTGEAFIENEIQVFSQYYDKIMIVACEVPKEEKKIRKLPENVTAYRIDSVSKNKDRMTGLMKYFCSGNPDLKSERMECKSFVQKFFLSYFEAKSQRICRSILQENIIEQLGQSPYVLYSYWLFVTARVGTLISTHKKPVYMFTRAHRYDLYADKNKLNYIPFRNKLLSCYNKILPCSDNGTEYLRQHYPKYSDKIQTAFLGTTDHGISRESTDEFFRIYSCSRIVSVKRVDRIVNALKILDNKGLKLKWTHIGGGEGLETLKTMAANELKNIQYEFSGDIPNQKVLEIYHQNPVDLFVNVSSSEGLPVSIMEAISFGIPTVATDVGGTSEIVFDDLTGKLLPENFDDRELAKTIEEFYNIHHSERYKKYRTDCREFWEEHFQALANYNQLCQYIETQYKI